MKDATAAAAMTSSGRGGGGGASGGGEKVRSVSDKEKTKMRERQRRSITTNIFHGLRKHGGYPLSPRADINEVLRHLANEAGWIVDPDGTTYRHSPTPSSGFASCSVCGAGKRSATSTPTSSVVLGGECSTTASPRRFQVGDSVLGAGGPPTSPYLAGCGGSGIGDVVTSERDIPLALYMYGGLQHSGPTGEPSTAAVTYQQQRQLYLQEARASNHNTPTASPPRRA
ncbi:hypothetical protein PVL29_013371 [Vitis rotundifolia]|uniref:Protein BZR1 homolog n=1 Tax=Vitis rotundifolia TaxID=103349 RepID=A0AA38ZMQ6_VITRO|nr:hypothetical protein PVL29_013371 [Vitis rotundifolia]